MMNGRFESLIPRLEDAAREHPRRYLVKALTVVLLGFAVLAVAILFALVPAALFVGLVILVVATGGKGLILLLKLGKLLVLLTLPAWIMIKSSVQMIFSRFPRPQGRVLTEGEAPALFARIDELRRCMHGPRIHHVLLTDELNAAIVQHPRFGLFGGEENYLILGLPLLQTLSDKEALAVVAHEYGHLSGHHSRLGGFIYRFRNAWGRMQTISEQWKDWGSRLIARLFSWYAPYFNAYTFVLARQNEYVADRISAEMAGTRNAANALMRVNIAAQFENEVFWPDIDRMAAERPQPPNDRSRFWVESLGERLNESVRQRYLEIARQRRTDHFDTHPALSDRLKAMGMKADDAAARELALPAHSAAELWLGGSLQSIEAEFDQKWQQEASEPWQERHRYLDECRQNLTRLQTQESLTEEERWECIQLTGELSPNQDLIPLLDVLLHQSPDHASALYRRGMLLLEKGDEAGIADLEHVMEKDADATLPSCEAAWRFFLERDPERAEQYRGRWLARSDYEDSVRAEFQTLPPDAMLAAPELDAVTEDRISRMVHEHGKHIRRAYLMRRILKTDPALHDYVLAFETRYVTLGDKGPEVVKRLAKQQYPVDLFIVHLGSAAYKRFRKNIKQMKIAPILGRQDAG
jgi:Zn-dependent protease with chaperone function